jgi:hypothetical protein
MDMLRLKERKTTRLIAHRVKGKIEMYNKIKFAMEEGKSKIGPKIE